MRITLFFILLYSLLSCTKEKNEIQGTWRAELYMQNDTLPFNFILEKDSSFQLFLLNGKEKILIDDIEIINDSLFADMHIFDSQLRAKIEDNSMSGVFIKNYTPGYILQFTAQKGLNYRFSANPKTDNLLEGKWAVMFESSLEDSTFSIAQFKQEGSLLTGTFLTTTGDYRYLQGELNGNKMSLSCFDGEHAFLFKADINEKNELNGVFKSGKTWNETWQAVENDTINLADPYDLTYLNPGFDSIFFKFQNLDGDSIEFPNSDYNDKAVLIQIFGTWCPNCMDETVFLSNWYNNHKKDDVKILALAYERKDDLNYARERINKMKSRLNVNYDFLFAGHSDKEYASSTLPMLNGIISYPTLIILDKEHNVRKIHTGFTGPGTGEYYEKFKLEFDQIMDEILKEEQSPN